MHFGQPLGTGSGEGPSRGDVAVHNVKIFNHHAGQELEVQVPEDRSDMQMLLVPAVCSICYLDKLSIFESLHENIPANKASQ